LREVVASPDRFRVLALLVDGEKDDLASFAGQIAQVAVDFRIRYLENDDQRELAFSRFREGALEILGLGQDSRRGSLLGASAILVGFVAVLGRGHWRDQEQGQCKAGEAECEVAFCSHHDSP
jgi:hypothetical protein